MERIEMDRPRSSTSAPRDIIEESLDFYTSVYVTDYNGVLREVEIWYSASDGDYWGLESSSIEFSFCYADKSDRLHKIMTLCMLQRSSSLWEVQEVSLCKNFQGLGLAAKLYASLLMLNPSLVLQSGYCQSPGGRKIWCDLAMMENVFVFGGYGDNAQEFLPVDVLPDTDYMELRGENDRDLYEDHDLSLFACKSRA